MKATNWQQIINQIKSKVVPELVITARCHGNCTKECAKKSKKQLNIK